MNPLNTVKWPLIIGFVLAVVIAFLVEGSLTFNSITLAAFTRWAQACAAHVLDLIHQSSKIAA